MIKKSKTGWVVEFSGVNGHGCLQQGEFSARRVLISHATAAHFGWSPDTDLDDDDFASTLRGLVRDGHGRVLSRGVEVS